MLYADIPQQYLFRKVVLRKRELVATFLFFFVQYYTRGRAEMAWGGE